METLPTDTEDIVAKDGYDILARDILLVVLFLRNISQPEDVLADVIAATKLKRFSWLASKNSSSR